VSPGEVAAILFGTFAVLVVLRVPVAFALGLAVVPVFFIDDRLTHQEIANLTATSRQTVTTVLNELRNKEDEQSIREIVNTVKLEKGDRYV